MTSQQATAVKPQQQPQETQWQLEHKQLGSLSVIGKTSHTSIEWHCQHNTFSCLCTITAPVSVQAQLESFHLQGNLAYESVQTLVLLLCDWTFSCHREIEQIVVHEELQTLFPRDLMDGQALRRDSFYQWPQLWTSAQSLSCRPCQFTHSTEGQRSVRHPKRPPQPKGELYRRFVPSLGRWLSFRVIQAREDLDLFHQWMNQTRVAPVWELGKPKEELYQYLVEHEQDPHCISCIGCFDDEPFGYFELYWTPEDRLGGYYDYWPHDRGLHLLVGNRRFLGKHYFHAWLTGLSHFLFLDEPRTMRLYGEPRADNRGLLQYTQSIPCWHLLREFDFPHKRAALMETTRDRFFNGEVIL